ncbi:MAG: hypothetical protein ACI33M_01800 [Lysinibacillus sp.]
MMYGSFFYNCWAALLGFTVYFFVVLQQPYVMPVSALIGAFVTALIVFLCTFLVRMFLGYVLYTPEEVGFQEPLEVEGQPNTSEGLQAPLVEQTLTVEFEDESSEEVAKVVRTMMHSESQSIPSRS